MKKTFVTFFFLCSVYILAQNKNQVDAKGQKQGYWEKTDLATNKLTYKGTFKNDKPQGLFTYYYKGCDSTHSKVDFRQDGKVAYATLYNIDGTKQAKGKYIQEKKDSIWNFYDAKGVLISSENYIGGKKDGVSKVFYENGVVSEEKNYKNGLEEGAFKSYYSDKTIKSEGSYFNGQFNGKCTWYYPGKTIAAQGFYENGLKKGVWIYNSSDGKKPTKEVWEKGKQLSDKETEEYFKKKQEEKATSQKK
ncbi:MAG: hypothetical protein JST67_08845 [Bacteroidetes bacterium]|nr:hypothetical protein [Bacteroidota bacterium]